MTTPLALAAHKAMTTVPKVVRVIRAATVSDDLQRQFDAADQQNSRDVGQVCMAVCRALIAHGFGTAPNDEQVAQFMDDAIGDPAFPARAHRLLGEMRKAASWRRRAFLASMLYGLSFRSLPDDERDRVDMAVERMMPGDAELLARIDGGRRSPPRKPMPNMNIGPSNVFALIGGTELRLAVTDHWDGVGLQDQVLKDDAARADLVALASLQSLGCVRIGERGAAQGVWIEYPLTITAVGELVIRAIEEVRAGIDASDASAGSQPAPARPTT